MSNINIGLPEGRPSSKVLKQPGGGHTDIFSPMKPSQIQKKQAPHSQIKECMNMTESITNQEKCQKDNNQNDQTDNQQNGDGDKLQATPARVRVPPGGFSSGFW